MGTNRNQNTGATTLKISVTDKTTVYKQTYFRELQNIITGSSLSVSFDNFHDSMDWNTTSVSQPISDITYSDSYSSRATNSSHPTVDQLTVTTTNNQFTASTDLNTDSILVETATNQSTSQDKSTQLVISYSNATPYTSETITQGHRVIQIQDYTITSVDVSDSYIEQTPYLETWTFYPVILRIGITFGTPRYSGTRYYVVADISDGNN